MEQNHLDILQKTLNLNKNKSLSKANNFIRLNKDTNIAEFIKNGQCDNIIFYGGFFWSNDHLMAYIIADSIIRHKAGDTYLNSCINALLAKIKSSKYYTKNPTIFTNVRELVQKCLTAYNNSQTIAPKEHPAKAEALTSKQLKRQKQIEEAILRNQRVTTIPSTYSNGFSSLYREQMQSRISPDDDFEFGMSDID